MESDGTSHGILLVIIIVLCHIFHVSQPPHGIFHGTSRGKSQWIMFFAWKVPWGLSFPVRCPLGSYRACMGPSDFA